MKQDSRKWLVAAIGVVLALAVFTPQASAQYLGQVTTAKTLPRGTNDVGGFLGVFGHVTSVFGQYRYGVSNGIDMGIQAGILDHDSKSVDHDSKSVDASLIIGGDVKFNVMSGAQDPFDLALGARMTFFEIGNASHFAIGGSVLLSHDYRLTQGSMLVPYGGVNVSLVHTSTDAVTVEHQPKLHAQVLADGSKGNTDLEISGVGGVKWERSDLIDAFGEMVIGGIDDDWGLVLGLNFKL